MQDVYIS